MKFCPTCETKYDEEILRFCIKDGTPLVDEKQPEFKEIPSETPDDEDLGEQTIIRRNKPSTPLPPPPPPQPVDSGTERLDSNTVQSDTQNTSQSSREDSDSKRIVISTEKAPVEQAIRAKETGPSEDRHRTKKKSNAALVALLSIVGTLVVLAGAVGVYWMLSSGNTTDANTNQNANIDTNLDDNLDTNFNADDLINNLNINTNANANDNANANVNINANANTKTPTPSPSTTPTPSPSPSPSATANSNTNSAVNTTGGNNASPTKTPTPTPAPTATPTPVKTPTPNTNTNTPVNVGQINGRAINLPTPAYTPAARQARASGRVTVRVIVDENGKVVAATATSGHPLLRRSAVQAARRSQFRPVTRNGQNVKSTGVIAYNFVN